MALNDVWRNIGSEIGIYYEANFDQVPSSSGVYAWFYPLRVVSKSADELERIVALVQRLLNYDPTVGGIPKREANLALAWWSWSISAGRLPKPLQFTEALQKAWTHITADDEMFQDFQRSLLKATIFMPPLYVGKAANLNIRCGQHLAGSVGGNDFHRRFEECARAIDLPIRSVQQLIFACVRTAPPADDQAAISSPVHDLVEAIMKSVCAPAYGLR